MACALCLQAPVNVERKTKMMLVKVALRDSPIHGRGVFAAEFIPRDRMIWMFDAKVDALYKEDEVEGFDKALRDEVHHFGYLFKQSSGERVWVFCQDEARYMNHSETPNTYFSYETSIYGDDYAARDIHIGEEITCNYKLWDEDTSKLL